MTGKREKPFKLDMPFGEAFTRFARTAPGEVQNTAQPAPYNISDNKRLRVNNTVQPAAPGQRVLDLGIEVQRNVNGVEMGVLENGIPFLTQTGLAAVCGVARSVIFDISQAWEKSFDEPVIQRDRTGWLREKLFAQGYKEPKLFIETKRDNAVNNAYPDVVCMAIIEYYAFEAKSRVDANGRTTPNKALESFRKLATFGLQKFIYDALNYQPGDKWRYHHDRVSILKNSSPDGHWIIFNEITGLIVDLITADLTVNSKTIPDISVGLCWGQFWEENGLEGQFGPRIRFEHNYPSYYPQAASNPQSPWAYPDESLPEFRRWFRREYLLTRFPKYILTKAKLLPGGRGEAMAIGAIYQPKIIAPPDTD